MRLGIGITHSYNTFLPTSIGGTALKLWLRADKGITLASGDVSQWDDQSGNGNHVSQATAANRPLFVASGQNSRPLVRCTAANSDVLYRDADLTGTGAYTAFWVGSCPDSGVVKSL